MGAIQNSINQVLGSVAGAALGIKHTAEQQAAVKEQKINNELQKAGVAEKLAGEKEQLASLNEGIKKGKADIKTIKEGWLPQEDGTRVADLFRSDEEKSADLKARRTALKTLQEKKAAKQMMIAAYEKVLGGVK